MNTRNAYFFLRPNTSKPSFIKIELKSCVGSFLDSTQAQVETKILGPLTVV